MLVLGDDDLVRLYSSVESQVSEGKEEIDFDFNVNFRQPLRLGDTLPPTPSMRGGEILLLLGDITLTPLLGDPSDNRFLGISLSARR